MSIIDNERAKLTANWLNGLSVATFAVGGLAPLLSTFYGSATSGPVVTLTVVSVVCVIASVALHFAGRRVLRGLQP